MTKMPAITIANLNAMRRMGATDARLTDIKDAYVTMAKARIYRPEAPNDGWGGIQLTDEEIADPIRLEMEGWFAAKKWYDADQDMEFIIKGCADGRNAAAMYLILQAAQVCCSGVHPAIRRLLELAIATLPQTQDRG